MANRFWVGGNANWDATAGTKWATTSGGAGGAAVPTAADDVLLDAGSGANTVTIPTATTVVCRSIVCTGFTGTLAMASTTANMNVGDGSGGVLTFVAGMTLTLTGVGNLSFVSTSSNAGAGWNITTGGKTMPHLIFNGAGGKWKLQDTVTGHSTAVFTISQGTLDTNNQSVTCGQFSSGSSLARTLTLGSSAISVTGAGTAWSFATTTNLTVSANTATVTLSGATVTFASGSFDWNGMSVVINGAGFPVTSGAFTVANFTRTGTTTKFDTLSITGGNVTVTGTATFTGNSLTNRLMVQTDAAGTTRTLALSGGTLTNTNVDFADITVTGTPTQNTSSVGNAGGNTGITFTGAVTRYAVVAGNWSSTATWSATSGGSGGASVPLCHDTVVMNASSAAGTYAGDQPRMCGDIDFTGFTRTVTLGVNGGGLHLGNSMYGNFVGATGFTFTAGSGNLFLAGRGAQTITCNGMNIAPGNNRIVSISAPGGSYTCQDTFKSSASNGTFQVDYGTFDANNFDVTIEKFDSANSNVRTITMGTGTWTLQLVGNQIAWNTATTTNLTFNGSNATIVIANASANSRSFQGGGLTYGTLTYTVGGSPGRLTITGSNTFGAFNFTDALNPRVLIITGNTTQTITNTWNVNGTAVGNFINMQSSGTNLYTISKASGAVVSQWMQISRCTATGGATFDAFTSQDQGNNTGWRFRSGDAMSQNIRPALFKPGNAR